MTLVKSLHNIYVIMPKKYYHKGFNGAEALKKEFVEAEGGVEAVAEVVCGAPEGGHLEDVAT
jgi:hypothetical protein